MCYLVLAQSKQRCARPLRVVLKCMKYLTSVFGDEGFPGTLMWTFLPLGCEPLLKPKSLLLLEVVSFKKDCSYR